ncbi:MAG: hypothetical protein ACK5KO_09245, partial [Arachnia sp.]
NQRANAGPDQSYLDFRSSSGRCAPSRHPAEDHPQVLIIARVIVTPEVAYVRTGLGVRISIGADDPSDVAVIVEVVAAIMNGDAEEYFGTGDDGPLTSIGHRVWYLHGSRATEKIASAVTVRAPRWS